MKNILKTTAISSMGLFCCFALDAMELESSDISEEALKPAGVKVVTIQAVGGEGLSQDDLVYLMNSMANYVLPSGKRISINAEPFTPIDVVQPQNQLSISSSSSFDKRGIDDIQVGHSDDMQVGDNDLKKEKIVTIRDGYSKPSFSGVRLKKKLIANKIDLNAIEELEFMRPAGGYFSFDGFPYLPNLKKLKLWCELDSFNGFPRLPNLIEISAAFNGSAIVNSFEGFPNLPNLEILCISTNCLRELESVILSALPKLRKLRLSDLVIKGINDNYGNEKYISATITRNDLIELSKKLPNCKIIIANSYYDYIFKDGQLTKKTR